MPTIQLRKVAPDAFRCVDDEGVEALQRVKLGDAIEVQWRAVRNYKFLRKFMAMVRLGYEAWEPEPLPKPLATRPLKNFDAFRETVTILAGFGEPVFVMGDEVYTLRAKSISFGKMSEEEFQQVYDKVATVILEQVLTTYTRADLDRVVEELLRFTA